MDLMQTVIVNNKTNTYSTLSIGKIQANVSLYREMATHVIQAMLVPPDTTGCSSTQHTTTITMPPDGTGWCGGGGSLPGISLTQQTPQNNNTSRQSVSRWSNRRITGCAIQTCVDGFGLRKRTALDLSGREHGVHSGSRILT